MAFNLNLVTIILVFLVNVIMEIQLVIDISESPPFNFPTITMRFATTISTGTNLICYVPILKTAAAVGTSGEIKISEINYKNLRSTTGNTLKASYEYNIGTKTFTSDSPGVINIKR